MMLDAYGLPIDSRAAQERRLQMAQEAYRASCSRRGVTGDWAALPTDERHLWLMTAEVIITRGLDDALDAVA